MKKRIYPLFIFLFLTASLFLKAPAYAKTPEIMASLRSYIKTYGSLGNQSYSAGNLYTSKISYQKNKKRFLFQCAYSNGNSVTSIKMYMPVAKKKASYTVYYAQTIRAKGKKAVLTGKGVLKRKSYNNLTTNLKFSRKNKNKWAKYITNTPFQTAANSHLKIAFWMWENALEKGPTLCFRNFGFNKITVYDPAIYTKEW